MNCALAKQSCISLLFHNQSTKDDFTNFWHLFYIRTQNFSSCLASSHRASHSEAVISNVFQSPHPSLSSSLHSSLCIIGISYWSARTLLLSALRFSPSLLLFFSRRSCPSLLPPTDYINTIPPSLFLLPPSPSSFFSLYLPPSLPPSHPSHYINRLLRACVLSSSSFY